MATRTVRSGDTLSGIAAHYGMGWRELYYHDANQAFRERRPNPDVIEPGDVLWVPDSQSAPDSSPRSIVARLEIEPAKTTRINPELFHENRHLLAYRVRTGDTIDSIAKACGCSWKELALLNWNTDDPDEINWHLQHYFVCRTKIGANYIFTDQDEPGILLLPRLLDAAAGPRKRTVRASRFPVT